MDGSRIQLPEAWNCGTIQSCLCPRSHRVFVALCVPPCRVPSEIIYVKHSPLCPVARETPDTPLDAKGFAGDKIAGCMTAGASGETSVCGLRHSEFLRRFIENVSDRFGLDKVRLHWRPCEHRFTVHAKRPLRLS